MTRSLTLLLAAGATAALVSAAGLAVAAARELPPVRREHARYLAWWRARLELVRLDPRLATLPAVQLGAALLTLVAVYATRQPALVLVALTLLAGPPVVVLALTRRRRDALAAQLDGMLTGLANALATTPNLGDALRSLLDTADEPMRQELAGVLGEVRVGRPLDEALTALAARSGVAGFEVAVAAAIMGRQTGGDLPAILRRTAATLREMARLEGVVRTKTAEGRTQSLVMGLVPPLLILALHKIDPEWLTPLWQDPIGWIILGLAATFEVAAVALIRRIMAVEL